MRTPTPTPMSTRQAQRGTRSPHSRAPARDRAADAVAHPPYAAREQVAQRLDVALVGAHDAMVEPELEEQSDLLFAQSPHLMGVIRTHSGARGVHEHALAGFEVLETRESHVGQRFVTRIDEHH